MHVEITKKCDKSSGKTGAPCGKRDAETHKLTVCGDAYELELCDKDLTRMRELLAGITPHARRTSLSKRARTAITRRRSEDIRKWAKVNNIDISDRGRIPVLVEARYNIEHP